MTTYQDLLLIVAPVSHQFVQLCSAHEAEIAADHRIDWLLIVYLFNWLIGNSDYLEFCTTVDNSVSLLLRFWSCLLSTFRPISINDQHRPQLPPLPPPLLRWSGAWGSLLLERFPWMVIDTMSCTEAPSEQEPRKGRLASLEGHRKWLGRSFITYSWSFFACS